VSRRYLDISATPHHGEPPPVDAQQDARPVWALHGDLQFAAGGLDVLAEGIDPAGAQIAVFHLRDAVLSDPDGRRERGLGVAGVFAKLPKAVPRNLTVHLILDRVNAGTVAGTAAPKVVELGHRFFLFLIVGLAAFAASASFINFSWCALNRRSAMGIFVAYHFVQFPALSPATSRIARDLMSKANITRMWAPPLVARGPKLLHVRVRRSFEGVHERSARNRPVFL
jgi:hypothetical protein